MDVELPQNHVVPGKFSRPLDDGSFKPLHSEKIHNFCHYRASAFFEANEGVSIRPTRVNQQIFHGKYDENKFAQERIVEGLVKL